MRSALANCNDCGSAGSQLNPPPFLAPAFKMPARDETATSPRTLLRAPRGAGPTACAHLRSCRRDVTRAENPPLMGATDRLAPHCLHCMYIRRVACSLSSSADENAVGPGQHAQRTLRVSWQARCPGGAAPVSLLLHREHSTYSIMYFLSTFSMDLGWNRPLTISLCFPSIDPDAPNCSQPTGCAVSEGRAKRRTKAPRQRHQNQIERQARQTT